MQLPEDVDVEPGNMRKDAFENQGLQLRNEYSMERRSCLRSLDKAIVQSAYHSVGKNRVPWPLTFASAVLRQSLGNLNRTNRMIVANPFYGGLRDAHEIDCA